MNLSDNRPWVVVRLWQRYRRLARALVRLLLRHLARPSRRVYQRSVLYGTLGLTLWVVLLGLYHTHAVAAKLQQSVLAALAHNTWLKPQLHFAGRRVYLTGVLESAWDLRPQIDLLNAVPGVSRVVNRLQVVSRPAAELHLTRHADEVTLRGVFNVDHLDILLEQVRGAFPTATVLDHIQIDDRRGRPLWLDGLGDALKYLRPLQRFSLSGWRAQLWLNGSVETPQAARQLGYGVRIPLGPEIQVHNRLYTPVLPHQADLNLRVAWYGASITARLAERALGETLAQAVQTHFAPPSLKPTWQLHTDTTGHGLLRLVLNLLPVLAPLREVHLQTSQQGLHIWGRAETAHHLGDLIERLDELGVEHQVINQVVVDPGRVAPVLALFADHQRVFIDGVLPSYKSHQALLAHLRQQYPPERIHDSIEVQPEVALARWTEQWPQLLQILPRRVAGLSIDANTVLVNGIVADHTEAHRLQQRLQSLFPARQKLNWTTIQARR